MNNYIVFTENGIKVEIRDADDVEVKPEGDLWFWKDVEIEDNPDVRAEAIAVFASGSWNFFMRQDAGDVYVREDQDGG